MELFRNKPLPPKRSYQTVELDSLVSRMCVGDCVVGTKKEALRIGLRLRRRHIKHATRKLPGNKNEYGTWKLSVGEK